MARRAIRVIDVVELFQHWHAGRRIGELSSSLGMDPKTVRKYLRPAPEPADRRDPAALPNDGFSHGVGNTPHR